MNAYAAHLWAEQHRVDLYCGMTLLDPNRYRVGVGGLHYTYTFRFERDGKKYQDGFVLVWGDAPIDHTALFVRVVELAQETLARLNKPKEGYAK